MPHELPSGTPAPAPAWRYVSLFMPPLLMMAKIDAGADLVILSPYA